MVPEKIMKEKIDSVNKIEKQRYPQRGSYFVGLFSNYRLIIIRNQENKIINLILTGYS
jgi:hypothetical protein